MNQQVDLLALLFNTEEIAPVAAVAKKIATKPPVRVASFGQMYGVWVGIACVSTHLTEKAAIRAASLIS